MAPGDKESWSVRPIQIRSSGVLSDGRVEDGNRISAHE
jgi:hypothetical protein